jgi:guanine deaminase
MKKNQGDPKFMQLAIDVAYKGVNSGAGGPFGAVIVRDGEIISEGHNCVIRDIDPTAHAEVTAIRNAATALGKFDLSNCEIYVNGMPCPMCMGAILWARIERVYYACDPEAARMIGFDDAKFYAEMKKAPAKREVPFVQMIHMVPKAQDCYRSWLKKIDRVPY